MDLPLSFYIIGAILVFFIGVSKAGIAGGATSLSVPILALFVSPLVAAGILLPLMLVVDVAAITAYRKHVSWRHLKYCLPGGMIGIGAGTLMVGSVTPEHIKLIVGLIALWFAALYFFKPFLPQMVGPLPPQTGSLFAAVSGFTSHLAHAGAPPMRGFLLGQNLQKTPFLATFCVFFFIVNLVKLGAYIAVGQINYQTLWLSFCLAPLLPIGIWFGLKLHKAIPQNLFVKISYLLLLFAGLKLSYDYLVSVL